jgi:hypothetical protein
MQTHIENKRMKTRGAENRTGGGGGGPKKIGVDTSRSHTRDPVGGLPRHSQNRKTCLVIPTTHPHTENYRVTFTRTMLANITRLLFIRRCLNLKICWNVLSQNAAFCPPHPPKQNPFPETHNKAASVV